MYFLKSSLPVIKNRLPEALHLAITSLENNTLKYEWDENLSCNCGVIVDAMCESKDEAYKLWKNARIEAGHRFQRNNLTWRDVCQTSCSVTGRPLSKVFEKLAEYGFQPKDVVHLEYMDNPAILKESGINTSKYYYASKDNLIKYLKAWVKILDHKTEREGFTKKQHLEADLLIATAFENFEEANKLTKLLAKI